MAGKSLEVETPEQSDLAEQKSENPNPIQPANIVNFVVFLVNAAIFYVAEFTSVFPNGNFQSASTMHQTILSPYHEGNDDSVMVWHAIFLWEFVFVLAQMLPAYRQVLLVRYITPWWIMACTFQIAWVVALMVGERSQLPLVTVLMALNFAVLMLLILRIEMTGKRTFFQYWLLRAPFSIHAGYMMVVSLAYVNASLQGDPDNKTGVLIGTSMTGVTAILTTSAVMSMATPRPDGFFCMGTAWAFYWIFRELNRQPRAPYLRMNIKEHEVSDRTLHAFELAAQSVAFMLACMAVLAVLLRVASCMQRSRL